LKILKNRIFLSALCIIVATAISFGLLPKFYEDKSATIMVLRASEEIPMGTEIKDNHLTIVEVGNYGLPEGVINDKDTVLGKVAQTNIIKGDYFFPQKLGGFLVNELLDRITKNNQRLVTISVPSIAAGLSSHLQNGDIVTVAVFLEQASDGQHSSPQIIIYPELKGLEVYSVENARTQDTAEMREQQKNGQSPNGDTVPKAVTLIVTEAQAEKLIQAEYTGKLHIIFEKRGVMNYEQ
jgi:pilus assembly protein CpaB